MSGHSPGTWIHVTLNSVFQCNDRFRYRLKEGHNSRPFSNPLVGTSGEWLIAKQDISAVGLIYYLMAF